MADKQTRHAILSPDNRGPYVIITSYIMMCIMILSTVARLRPTRKTFTQAPSLDGVLLICASIIAIAQSAVVQVAVENGLGRSRVTLSNAEYARYSKANYVSQLLYIAVLCLSKLSLTVFVSHLTPGKSILISCRILLYSVSAWALAATFALAFQCQLPRPWDFTHGRCLNQDVLYHFNGAFNILTDWLIFIIPVLIVWDLQISQLQRWTVISVFAVKPIATIANVLQLVYLGFHLHSSDQTQSNVTPSIWTQVVLNLSIITVCIPSLKPLLVSLQCGCLDASVREQSSDLRPSGNSWNLPVWNNTRTMVTAGTGGSTRKLRMRTTNS